MNRPRQSSSRSEPDSGYTIGGSGNTTAYIYDNDAQVISLGSADAFEGGANGLFRFHRIGDLSGGLTVNFTVGGTATSGTDYTSIGTSVNFAAWASYADVVITALPDNLVEDPEYVQATLASGTGYSIGSPNYSLVFIHDDPPVVEVAAGADALEGSNYHGYFRLTRTGGDITATLTVTYTIGGTASSGTDFTAMSGTVMFAANEDTAIVSVEALHDTYYDPSETVLLTITGGGTTYTIGTLDEASIAILEDADRTFTVDANVGAIWYEVPWEDVDPDEAFQSLPLSDFLLTLAGETFTASSISFVTEPSIEFEYGVIAGITFEIDTSGLTSYAYTNISATGFTLSVIDALTSQQINVPKRDFGSVTMDFSQATNNLVWKAAITVTYWEWDDEYQEFFEDEITIEREFLAAAQATHIVNEFKLVLSENKFKAKPTPDGKSLTIGGTATLQVTAVVYKTYIFQENNVFVPWLYDKDLNAPRPVGKRPSKYSFFVCAWVV